jgi:hypothetical protein
VLVVFLRGAIKKRENSWGIVNVLVVGKKYCYYSMIIITIILHFLLHVLFFIVNSNGEDSNKKMGMCFKINMY